MKLAVIFLISAFAMSAETPTAPKPSVDSSVERLLNVKRIYVAELIGGVQADALRGLIISSLDSTKLFVLTDNPDRADAVLKGAADDHTFTDTFDANDSLSTRQTGGKSGSSGSSRTAGGIYGGLSVGESESYHTAERKHEAYAAVRLCNRDGDVIWSTTQESLGAKFRGASADVAEKVARQLTMDFDRERRTAAAAPTTAPGEKAIITQRTP